jgi:putative spermidine/putrescine transport system permease protein
MNQQTPVEIRPPRDYSVFLLYVLCGLILFYLVVPILIIIPLAFSSASHLTFPPPGISLRWWEEYFSRRDWTGATLLSFQVAMVTMFLATTLGTLASFPLVRSRFPGKNLVYALILSPIILPIIITAIATYFFFARLQLIGNWLTIALGHTILALPIVIIIVSASLKSFDQALEHAALSLGADRLRTFWYVTFPLIRSGVFTAALFAFLTSFDELLIALFLSGERAKTLPRRMWDGLRLEINPTIAVVSTILILLTCILLLLISELSHRRSKQSIQGADKK